MMIIDEMIIDMLYTTNKEIVKIWSHDKLILSDLKE